MILKSIDEPNPSIKYKRRIWAGVRNDPPNLSDPLYIGSHISFKDNILREQEFPKRYELYPTLIVYETLSGERKYIEVRREAY